MKLVMLNLLCEGAVSKKTHPKVKTNETEVDVFLWCVSVYYSFENCT